MLTRARYLVRLDDACPTMRHDVWDPLERVLDSMSIMPIVGVIPDNQDPKLMLSSADKNFWERVRSWQRKGWTIAMHGLHHVYHTIPQGARALLPVRRRSEFVGLNLERQREIIRRARQIFAEQGVNPSMFMAPSHSFDANTLRALEQETKIRTITDGHALAPYREGEFVWIPQQLWHFRYLPLGTWSVCLHPNSMTIADVKTLAATLMRYRHTILDPASIPRRSIRERSRLDHLITSLYAVLAWVKRSL